MTGPEKMNRGEVPRTSKARLFDRVAEYNVPFTDATISTHPIPMLHNTMREEHGPIFDWMSDVSHNIRTGLGVGSEHTPETRAFDNAAIIAYGLIRAGYEDAGVEIPGAQKPPEWYMWLGDEKDKPIGELFEAFNKRQRKVLDAYPDYLEAMQTWASERIPGYGSGQMVGAIGIAAAEMYFAFERTEAIAVMEQQFGES